MHQPLNTYMNKCNGYCIMMIFREQFKIVIKRVHIISYIHRIPIDYHSIGNICRITNDFMRAFSYQIHTSQARARFCDQTTHSLLRPNHTNLMDYIQRPLSLLFYLRSLVSFVESFNQIHDICTPEMDG